MSKLTTRGRKNVKPSNFAVPASKSNTGKPKYPVHDRTHAIRALGRVTQKGTPAEKAMVRKKVYKKYPSLDPKKK